MFTHVHVSGMYDNKLPSAYSFLTVFYTCRNWRSFLDSHIYNGCFIMYSVRPTLPLARVGLCSPYHSIGNPKSYCKKKKNLINLTRTKSNIYLKSLRGKSPPPWDASVIWPSHNVWHQWDFTINCVHCTLNCVEHQLDFHLSSCVFHFELPTQFNKIECGRSRRLVSGEETSLRPHFHWPWYAELMSRVCGL